MRTTLLIALLGSMLVGCSQVARVDVGAVTAFGEPLEQAEGDRYYLVRLDARGVPPDQLPRLALALPGAEAPIPIEALTPELAARHLPRFVPPAQWPETWKEKARRLPAFEGDGFYIGFDEAGLGFVSLCSHCHGGRQAPVLCTADGRVCHRLPLTRAQLIELTGPPDRERRVREVTY